MRCSRMWHLIRFYTVCYLFNNFKTQHHVVLVQTCSDFRTSMVRSWSVQMLIINMVKSFFCFFCVCECFFFCCCFFFVFFFWISLLSRMLRYLYSRHVYEKVTTNIPRSPWWCWYPGWREPVKYKNCKDFFWGRQSLCVLWCRCK